MGMQSVASMLAEDWVAMRGWAERPSYKIPAAEAHLLLRPYLFFKRSLLWVHYYRFLSS